MGESTQPTAWQRAILDTQLTINHELGAIWTWVKFLAGGIGLTFLLVFGLFIDRLPYMLQRLLELIS